MNFSHLAIHDKTIPHAADWAAHMAGLGLERHMPLSVSIGGKPHTLYLRTHNELCVFQNSDTPIIPDEPGLKSWHKRGRFRDTVHPVQFLITDEDDVAVSIGSGVFVNARISSGYLLDVVDGYTGEYNDLLTGVARMFGPWCPLGLHLDRVFFIPQYRNIEIVPEILGLFAHAAHSLNRQGMGYFMSTVNLRIESDEPIHFFMKHKAKDWSVCDSYEALLKIEVPHGDKPISPRVDYSGLVVWEGARNKVKLLRDIANLYHDLDLERGSIVKINGRDHWIAFNAEHGYGIDSARFIVVCDGKAVCVGSFLMTWVAAEYMDFNGDGLSGKDRYFMSAVDELEKAGAMDECDVIMEGVYLHPAYRDAESMAQIFRAVLGDNGGPKLAIIVKSDQSYRESLLTMATEYPMGRLKCRLLLVDLPQVDSPQKASAERRV